MAACVTQLRFVSNNNESNDLTAPLFPKTKHVCPARRSGTQAHVRWRFGTGISYQVWCLCLNAPPAPRAKEEAHPTSCANGSVLCVNAGNGERHIDPASACSSCRWPLYRSGPTGLLEDELACRKKSILKGFLNCRSSIWYHCNCMNFCKQFSTLCTRSLVQFS